MIINYKRLNDNTVDDAYNITNKLKIFPPNYSNSNQKIISL
jgi:hypothetical protein